MRMIYFHVMLENLSMFFYKSDDSIYMLEALLSQLNQASSQLQAIDKDFWIRSEDLLMRQKKDFDIGQLSRIAKVYSSISQGSNVFWQELEKQLLIKSSNFKNQDPNGKHLVNVVEAFCRANR